VSSLAIRDPGRVGGPGLVLRRRHVMIISPPDRNAKRILARLDQSALVVYNALRQWLDEEFRQ